MTKLDRYELELLMELVRDYRRGVNRGEIVGGDFSVEELDELHTKLADEREATK